jgi:hypothetical protein
MLAALIGHFQKHHGQRNTESQAIRLPYAAEEPTSEALTQAGRGLVLLVIAGLHRLPLMAIALYAARDRLSTGAPEKFLP